MLLPLTYFFNLLHFPHCSFFFFFNDTATTEIYTLSLHDALPIYTPCSACNGARLKPEALLWRVGTKRSEEHTSELQSHSDLVCRLLLEKKKKLEIQLRECGHVTCA